MNTVLITGASGLLGYAVVGEAAKWPEVQVVAVTSGRRKTVFPDNVIHITADLLKEADRVRVIETVRPHAVCHLAWALSDAGFGESDDNVRWLEASLHLLRLFAKNDGDRFIFAGSSSQYGGNYCGNTELYVSPSYSLYGATKFAFEQTAAEYSATRNISFSTARYFSIYGPRDVRPGRAIPTAIQTLLQGERFLCKGPNNIWDYIYIEDAAEATVRLLNSDYIGPINIASGRPVSMREVFTVIADELNRGHLLTFDETTRNNSILCANTAVMQEELGFACKVGLREGLVKTIQWWVEERQGEQSRVK